MMLLGDGGGEGSSVRRRGYGSGGRLAVALMAVGWMAAGSMVAASVSAAPVPAAPVPAAVATPQDGDAERSVKAKFAMMAACLAAGDEVVMAPAPTCVPQRTGAAIAEKAGMPLGERDWDKICATGHDADADPRRLGRDAVKRLARDVGTTSSGIRIVGALFCDGLDLADLDLPATLVLDRSVFEGPVDARNLRLAGDLGLEHVVVFDTVRLAHARIEGSVRAGGSFVRRLRVHDTQVAGSWQQKAAVVLLDADLVRLAVAGDLSLAHSAFTRLSVQASRIDGTLSLDDSEARCTYRVDGSTIGAVSARNAGFGRIVAVGVGAGAVRYAWWRRAVAGRPASHTQTLFRSADIAAEVEAERRRIAHPEWPPETGTGLRGCPGGEEAGDIAPERSGGLAGIPMSPHLAFSVLDSEVRSAFCLAGFAWASAGHDELPEPGHPATVLALDGTRIGGDLVIDLWGGRQSAVAALRAPHPEFARVAALHRLEAVGLTAGAAIYNFADHDKPYVTYLEGLRFARVHQAPPGCGVDHGGRIGRAATQPRIEAVLHWLGKNTAPSAQPFLAFAEAFEAAGVDAAALHIRRRTLALCERVVRWLPPATAYCPSLPALAVPAGPARPAGPAVAAAEPAGWIGTTGSVGTLPLVAGLPSGSGSEATGLSDLVGIGFGVILWGLADHGLRPSKVVWWALGTLAGFWLLLRFGFGVVGFVPAGAPDREGPLGLRPVGPLFLLDHLIPFLGIRDEHHAIARFYRTAGPAGSGSATPGAAATATAASQDQDPTQHPAQHPDRDPSGRPGQARLRRRTLLVRPVDNAERARIDHVLALLRVIGIVLTIVVVLAVIPVPTR